MENYKNLSIRKDTHRKIEEYKETTNKIPMWCIIEVLSHYLDDADVRKTIEEEWEVYRAERSRNWGNNLK